DTSDDEAIVPVASLTLVNPTAAGKAHHPQARVHGNWVRFIEHVFSAFRQNRGSLGTSTNTGAKTEKEEEEGNTSEPGVGEDPEAVAIEKSLIVFDQLFDLLLSGEPSHRNVTMAFDLTHYICGRLRPDVTRVKDWANKLVFALLKIGVPSERRDDVAGTILLL